MPADRDSGVQRGLVVFLIVRFHLHADFIRLQGGTPLAHLHQDIALHAVPGGASFLNMAQLHQRLLPLPGLKILLRMRPGFFRRHHDVPVMLSGLLQRFLIGKVQLHHFFLGFQLFFLIVLQIGMAGFGEPMVRLADLRFRRAARDPEYPVCVQRSLLR